MGQRGGAMALEKVTDGGACACVLLAVLVEMGPLGCWVTPGLARDWKVLERVREKACGLPGLLGS